MLNRLPIVSLLQSFFILCSWMASSQALAMHAGEEQDHDSLGHEEAVPEKSQEDDYSLMVKIPAGKFKRGSTFQEIKGYLAECKKFDKTCKLWWFEDEYPDHLVYLKSYWIDIFEVTNEKYLEFVKATGHRPALQRRGAVGRR